MPLKLLLLLIAPLLLLLLGRGNVTVLSVRVLSTMVTDRMRHSFEGQTHRDLQPGGRRLIYSIREAQAIELVHGEEDPILALSTPGTTVRPQSELTNSTSKPRSNRPPRTFHSASTNCAPLSARPSANAALRSPSAER